VIKKTQIVALIAEKRKKARLLRSKHKYLETNKRHSPPCFGSLDN
jgi:hypothetical protein